MKYEKYVLIALIIKGISILVAPIIGQYYLSNVLSTSPAYIFVSSSSFLWLFIGNLGFVYWLFKESKSYIWAAAALIFSLPAVILFYVLLHYLKKDN